MDENFTLSHCSGNPESVLRSECEQWSHCHLLNRTGRWWGGRPEVAVGQVFLRLRRPRVSCRTIPSTQKHLPVCLQEEMPFEGIQVCAPHSVFCSLFLPRPCPWTESAGCGCPAQSSLALQAARRSVRLPSVVLSPLATSWGAGWHAQHSGNWIGGCE